MQSEGTLFPAVALSPWPLHPPLSGCLYDLLPPTGWLKQPPQCLPLWANVLLFHAVGAQESTCHGFCTNNKEREKEPFWEAMSVGAELEAAELMAVLLPR